MSQELLKVLRIPSHEEKLLFIKNFILEYSVQACCIGLTADTIHALQKCGYSDIETLDNCMKISELFYDVNHKMGIGMMLQLYVLESDLYIYHIWDAIEIYIFSKPSYSTVECLNELLACETRPKIKTLFEYWRNKLLEALSH